MKTYEFEKIEKIIWNNEKLEKALDKILIDYEDVIFNAWVYEEIQARNLTDANKRKIFYKIKDTAFDFCGNDPMDFAKRYCEDAVDSIYDNDDNFTEDELVENLIIHCKNNLMMDMFAHCDF